MVPLSTVGTELELNLYNPDFRISDQAAFVLTHPLTRDNAGRRWLIHEATNSNVEINSNPAETIAELSADLRDKLINLEQICQEVGVLPITASEYGAGISEVFMEYEAMLENDFFRCRTYPKIFPAAGELPRVLGTHIHISQALTEEEKLKQAVLLEGVESLLPALTSTSPIRYDRVNGLNNHRIPLQRHTVFGPMPIFSQLQPYPTSLDDISRDNKKRVASFIEAAVKQGVDPIRLSEEFQEHNTGYQPVRKKDHIGPSGTWEIRSADTSPLSYLESSAALIKGLNDYMLSNSVAVEVATDDGKFSFSPGRFVVPNFATRQMMEKAYSERGFEIHPEHGDIMARFLRAALPYAEAGLPEMDRDYLRRAKQIASTQQNPASQLMHHLHTEMGLLGSKCSMEQAIAANKFMREMYLEDLA